MEKEHSYQDTRAPIAERVRDLMARLTDGIPPVRSERTEAQQAQWLLAQMLEFHHREDKAVWWEYFRLRDLTDEELLDERAALSGLKFLERVDTPKQSVVDRLTAGIATMARARKVRVVQGYARFASARRLRELRAYIPAEHPVYRRLFQLHGSV